MSLRESPTMTRALLDANRRNAQKSTGPRTAAGKAWSRINGLRKGTRSPFYRDLLKAMLYAPPGRVEQTARLILSPEAASHPLIARTVELFCQAEADMSRPSRRIGAFRTTGKKSMKKNDAPSRNVIENKAGRNKKFPRP